MEKEKNKPSFVSNISEIYKKIDFYRKGLITATICAVIQSVIILCLIFSNPIVIYEKEGERIGYIGKNEAVTISEGEIKELVKRFIRNRYEWGEFNPRVIAENLRPYTKKNLVTKVLTKLSSEMKQFEGKPIQQYVGKIHVSIDQENKIVGTFDKILRVQGIPLLSESQVLIGIVKGMTTKTNKLGLYINSVVDYETN